MSILDWILAAIVVLLAIRCLVRGFVKEAASIAAEITGLACALIFYEKLGSFINSKIALGAFANFVGFFAAFLAGFIVVMVIGRLLREGLEAANLEKLDSFLGFLGGLVEGIVLVAILLVVIQIQPVFDTKQILAESIFARTILPVIGPTVNKTLKPILGPNGRQLPKINIPLMIQPAAQPQAQPAAPTSSKTATPSRTATPSKTNTPVKK